MNSYGKTIAMIKTIQSKKKKKKWQREQCKERILWKLFHEKVTFLLTSNLFFVLKFFKSSLFIFEQKGPQIHWLHKMHVENLQTFSACFMKFKVLNDMVSDKLNFVDVAIQKMKTFYVGEKKTKS